ncbi:MAG: oligosaccharide flippase family protein [Pseudomonadota bacterium]
MLTTVFFRYLGTLLQFVVLAVIARSVSVEDYGIYMMCLSVTFSFYYVSGFGTSESGLAHLSRNRALEKEEGNGQIVGTVMGTTLACAAVLLCAAVIVYVLQPFAERTTNTAAIFILVFLSAAGIIFNVSQLLLGLGYSAVGSFFFYPAINLTLLFSTVPTALILSDVHFVNLSIATSLGACVAACVALFSVRRLTRALSHSWSFAQCKTLIYEGVGLTGVRILHVSSFWIPTMVTGFILAPALAGEMGTAGRIAIAVSAVIAAVRFFIRPAINRALATADMVELRRMLGSVAFITTSAGLLALIANEMVGEEVISFFFGQDLASASMTLTVLLLSVCAEAVFGPVDELLKANGQQKVVAWIYGIGVPFFLLGSILMANLGLIWIAWFQVVYVLGIFSAMNYVVYCKFGFAVFPLIPNLSEIRNLR